MQLDDPLHAPAGEYPCPRCGWLRRHYLVDRFSVWGDRLMRCEVCGAEQPAAEALLDAE